MRVLYMIVGDIRYQIKYGFYFLYGFMTLLYLGILAVIPDEYKSMAASIIILTDPAALGFFFIGGIWLLEKGEGVHKFYNISPLRPVEYAFSKAFSLSILSTLAGLLIALLGAPFGVNIPLLMVGLLLGSAFFTLMGLCIATYAKSVNHYMLIAAIPGTLMILPAILVAFGIEWFWLEFFPASILWRIIDASLQGLPVGILPVVGLLLWLAAMALIVTLRLPHALQEDGGATRNETNP